jgi:plasmid stabilization system protein ParE
MKKYLVRFNTEALTDMFGAYEWGIRNWGADAARRWFNDLERKIKSRLTSMPESCPVAPESGLRGREVRQLLHGRYRVLFTIEDNLVRVLYIRGPFVEQSSND